MRKLESIFKRNKIKITVNMITVEIQEVIEVYKNKYG